jgi:biotin carboxylase
VRYADRGDPHRPPPARESYLDIEKILDAVRKTGRRRRAPGLRLPRPRTKISPTPATPRASSSSVPRRLDAHDGRQDVGARDVTRPACPCPGRQRPGGRGFPTAEAALARRAKIGFPVMLKAAAGGGGKGMRLVDGEAKFVAA